MSRIGKKPVPLPGGVSATVSGQTVSVKGPKGTREFTATDDVTLKVEDGIVTRVAVETGIRDGGLVEIRSGLPLGATIVSRAGAFVRDGDHIHPVLADPGAATN